jgi:hypothetical protein
MAALQAGIASYNQQHQEGLPPFFGIIEDNDTLTIVDLKEVQQQQQQANDKVGWYIKIFLAV